MGGRATGDPEEHHLTPNHSDIQNNGLIGDLTEEGLWNQNNRDCNIILLGTDRSKIGSDYPASHRTSHGSYTEWYKVQLDVIEFSYGDNIHKAKLAV